MMMVSTKEYVLHTLYEMTIINLYFSPKELLVHWATEIYLINENQVAATVELVIDSTFEEAQVTIQGFSRQIPDGNPNRIDSLVVPGPVLPGTLMRSSSLCCVLFTLDTSICYFQMYAHLCHYT